MSGTMRGMFWILLLKMSSRLSIRNGSMSSENYYFSITAIFTIFRNQTREKDYPKLEIEFYKRHPTAYNSNETYLKPHFGPTVND